MENKVENMTDIFKELLGQQAFKNKKTVCKYIILKHIKMRGKVKRETVYQEVEKVSENIDYSIDEDDINSCLGQLITSKTINTESVEDKYYSYCKTNTPQTQMILDLLEPEVSDKNIKKIDKSIKKT